MYMRKLTRQVITNFDFPVVETKSGRIRGSLVEGIYIFRGIKYADARRFHQPEPVKPWDGIKPAVEFGYVAPEINTPIPHDEFYVPHYFYPQNEHCQYLNIWTQSLDKDRKRPVMVWLHGGGWFSGSSIEIYSYDGENLSAFGDVVVVSVNHRLNVLGYLDLSEYGKEYANSANAGLADLVAALRWIHDNIANFGGDPDRVMIFGQSGGGMKVLSMLQTPAADGLFHAAVVQSGGARGKFEADYDQERKDRRLFAKLLLQRLNIKPKNVREIETVDWYDLAQATAEVTWIFNNELHKRADWGPLADGKYYMGHPAAVGFREESKHIPLMVGTVLGEFSNNYNVKIGEGSKNKWSEEYKLQLIRERFGDKADAYIAEFRKAYPDRNLADVLYMDMSSRRGSIEFSKLRAAQEGAAPVYNWLFNLEAPFMDGTMPWHNAEEPYVFHNAEYIEAQYEPGVSEKLQDIMATAWVRFAGTGNPNHPGMPEWPQVKSDSCPTMLFDRVCEVRTDHDYDLVCLTPPPSRFSFPGSGIMAAIFGIKPADR
jgi:para-nitrobenzyl esterase